MNNTITDRGIIKLSNLELGGVIEVDSVKKINICPHCGDYLLLNNKSCICLRDKTETVINNIKGLKNVRFLDNGALYSLTEKREFVVGHPSSHKDTN